VKGKSAGAGEGDAVLVLPGPHDLGRNDAANKVCDDVGLHFVFARDDRGTVEKGGGGRHGDNHKAGALKNDEPGRVASVRPSGEQETLAQGVA
jgi:hypothetical protein